MSLAAQSATLARLEGMSRDDRLALQLAKLKRQLARVYEGNAFYRRHFDAAGVTPDANGRAKRDRLAAFAQRYSDWKARGCIEWFCMHGFGMRVVSRG